jgi:hypothetical protein
MYPLITGRYNTLCLKREIFQPLICQVVLNTLLRTSTVIAANQYRTLSWPMFLSHNSERF